MENLFDDIAPTPTTRARPGARFAPKAKPKQPPRKNVSASKDENNVHVVSSEGVSQNESHNAVAVSSSIEEPIKPDHHHHHPDTHLNNDNQLNNVAASSTISSTVVKMDELPQNGEGSFLETDKSLLVLDNSVEVSSNEGFKSASGDSNIAICESNIHSNFELGKVGEVLCAEIELDPFSNVLPDPGTGNAHKFQPKVKPRPTVSNTPDIASASSGIPFSDNNRSFEPVIPSNPDFLNMTSESVVHDGTRDLPSNYCKSAAEPADIVLGLESLYGILNQAATGTGKPDLKSSNVKGAEENFVLSEYDNKSRSESQEGANLNPSCPVDNVYDHQSMKSGTSPTFEIPRNERSTDSADGPTLADFLQIAGTREKEDANETKKSLKKHKRSSIAVLEDKGGKTLRQPRKQAVHKRGYELEAIKDDDVLDPPYDVDGDELEENEDEYGVDYSSKKKRASTSSKKKSVAENGKTPGKRKKANDDIEKVTEAALKNGKASRKRKKANGDIEKVTEAPPKKFPHSTRRRKRCVDKALLDDEFLDQRTLPIRDIILLADYKERLAKKEAATSKTSSTNQSDWDVLHEANANNEEEFFGLDDEFRDPDDDDQASEKFTSTAPLLNYQSFMNKAPRAKWSKQDTELFYKAVSFCTDFEMIQKLFFPDKTRHQIKLKYKKEERQHPLRLSDAVNNHATDLCHFKLVAESLQQTSNKEEQDTASDAPDFMPGEEVEVPTPGTNEEVATTVKDDIQVKDLEDPMADQQLEEYDDSEDELQKWAQYQSAI